MKYQYLFEFDSDIALSNVLAMAMAYDRDIVKFTRMAVDTEHEYDGEFRFATGDILPTLLRSVIETIKEDAIEFHDFVPMPDLSGDDEWRLIRMAVEWGYIGGGGVSFGAAVTRAWNEGQLDFLVKAPAHDRDDHPEPKRIDFLCNVLVTAAEGGINYWAELSGYKWEQDDQKNMTTARVSVKSHDGILYEVTPDVIQAGIDKVKSGVIELNKDILKAILVADVINDAGDIDSDAADCIVQAALFDKIVYG